MKHNMIDNMACKLLHPKYYMDVMENYDFIIPMKFKTDKIEKQLGIRVMKPDDKNGMVVQTVGFDFDENEVPASMTLYDEPKFVPLKFLAINSFVDLFALKGRFPDLKVVDSKNDTNEFSGIAIDFILDLEE